MGTAPNPDSFAISHQFKVEIDGGPSAYFHECAGLNIHVDVTEVQEGGKNDGTWKVAGPTRYENLVLKRGVTADRGFSEWVQKSVTRQISRTGGSIALVDANATEIARWNFKKGWCCRYEGPTMRSDGGHNIAIETVEIAHEGIERAR